MWVLNIIRIYFRGSACFLAEQCFRYSLGKGGKWGWVGGQKVMEAGGDSDLSLFTNRVPAKNLLRILVPKKANGLARQICGWQWLRWRDESELRIISPSVSQAPDIIERGTGSLTVFSRGNLCAEGKGQLWGNLCLACTVAEHHKAKLHKKMHW